MCADRNHEVTNRLPSISPPTSGCERSTDTLAPWGDGILSPETGGAIRVGESNSHLVVASDERLPGSDRRRAVHLHVGVVVFSDEHL